MALRYQILVYRREQLWLPLGLWALFAFIVTVFRTETRAFDMAGGFLGIVLPLISGVVATSAVVDDPVLELQMAAPRPPWRLLLERIAIIFGIVALTALTFEVFLFFVGVNVAALGNLVTLQFTWLVPSLAMIAFSSLVALGFAQGTVGVLAAGAVWIIQLLLRDWFAIDSRSKYVFLFLRALYPSSPDLAANHVFLLVLAVLFFVCAALLLRREERYL